MNSEHRYPFPNSDAHSPAELYLSRDGHVESCNTSMAELLRYSGSELSKKSIFHLSPRINLMIWQEWCDRTRENDSIQVDLELIKKSGETLKKEVRFIWLDEDTANGAVCKAVIDTSGQNSFSSYYLLAMHTLNELDHSVIWTDRDGMVLHANSCFEEKMNSKPGELRGRPLSGIFDMGDGEDWVDTWQAVRRAESSLEREFCTNTNHVEVNKKSRVPVILKYYRFEEDEFCLIREKLEDRGRSEREEDENTALLRDAINQMPDMIFCADQDGAIKYYNQSFLRLLGLNDQKIEKLTISKLFSVESQTAFDNEWKKLISENIDELSGEYEVQNLTGEKSWFHVKIHRIKFNDQIFYSALFSNIDKRREQDRQLKVQLKKISALKDQLEEENIVLKEEVEIEKKFESIITRSGKYKPIMRQVRQVAETEATVLIQGETGTGKELLAHAIYRQSKRSDKQIVKVNCSVLPESLIESELFGHERGSFTGAHKLRKGRFEMADGGTIFLDEIGEMPMELQPKLLRVLQEGEFRRVGGSETIRVDVRVIAATNRILEDLVDSGKFREDLYYRLNVFPIYNIPLRERKDDIPLLVSHFIKEFNNRLGRNIQEVPKPVMRKLLGYDYPGNIRELKNILERAVILSPDKKLITNFPLHENRKVNSTKFHSMEEMQRRHILKALERTRGKVSGKGGAAELLRMNDKTLYSRMKKLNIDRYDFLN